MNSVIPQEILVVDLDPDTRALLIRSLRASFPASKILQTDEGEDAARTLASIAGIDAVVIHRAMDADAVALIRSLRPVNPSVPIIAVSNFNRSESILAAGASGFLNFEQWRLLGAVVGNALNNSDKQLNS